MNLNQLQLTAIIDEAEQAAYEASYRFFNDVLGGKDQCMCGFAWVDICGVKGNTKLGKLLKAIGINQNSYTRTFQVWNPAKFNCQNMDTLEVGAKAYVDVLKKHGFSAYVGSRLD